MLPLNQHYSDKNQSTTLPSMNVIIKTMNAYASLVGLWRCGLTSVWLMKRIGADPGTTRTCVGLPSSTNLSISGFVILLYVWRVHVYFHSYELLFRGGSHYGEFLLVGKGMLIFKRHLNHIPITYRKRWSSRAVRRPYLYYIYRYIFVTPRTLHCHCSFDQPLWFVWFSVDWACELTLATYNDKRDAFGI